MRQTISKWETGETVSDNRMGRKISCPKDLQGKIEVEQYARELRNMLEDLKKRYGLNDLDSMLVLKDILYHEWKESKK